MYCSYVSVAGNSLVLTKMTILALTWMPYSSISSIDNMHHHLRTHIKTQTYTYILSHIYTYTYAYTRTRISLHQALIIATCFIYLALHSAMFPCSLSGTSAVLVDVIDLSSYCHISGQVMGPASDDHGYQMSIYLPWFTGAVDPREQIGQDHKA